MPARSEIVYVAHGGGNVGAAQGGVIGTINLTTFAYAPLTGSLGSLTSLVADGTSLYTYNTTNNSFLTINPITGDVVATTPRSGGEDPTDMAPNPVTGIFYAVGTDEQLYTVDIGTGVMTPVGSLSALDGGFIQIAIAPDGTLYAHATNSPGEFHTVDPSNAAILTTIPGGVPGGALGLAFNPSNGLLVASECCDGADFAVGERLYSVNPADGSATLLFDYDDGRRMQDFAFLSSVQTLPEPAGLLLIGPVLVTLVWARRWRMTRSVPA